MAKAKTKDRPLITDIDCATGESVTRPMTDEEYAAYLVVEDEATA